jgi:hypothetical protein
MGDTVLTEAYNAAVDALRCFHDAHLRIVVHYIVGPSHCGTPPCRLPRMSLITCRVVVQGVGEWQQRREVRELGIYAT